MKACLTPVMLCIAVAGCVAPAKNIGLESETETNVSGSGSGSGSESETETESETESESETETPTDCDFADAASCEAALDCAWVEITTIQGSGDFCGFEEPRNVCIKTFYQGEGCEFAPACGLDEGSPVYYVALPELGEDAYDMFSHPFCENQPVGYESCRWDGSELVSGPEACDCQCIDAPPVLPGNVEEQLVEQGGCSDLFVFAYNAASTLALTFNVDGEYAAQATETEMPVDVELAAGGDVIVQISTGQNLQSVYCTDVGGLGDITGTWTATEGTVALHIELVDGQPHATVTLDDVIFAPEAPAVGDYFLGNYVFEDVLVGWLPG